MDDLFLKAPPHNLDAEQSLLGGLLLESFRLDDLECLADDFYIKTHGLIFNAILAVSEKGTQVDIITVAEYLDANKQLGDVGGIAYIGDLMKNTAGAANVKRYAQIVREKALLRELVIVSSDITAKAYEAKIPPDELIAEAESTIYSISDKRETQEPVQIKTAIDEAIEHLGNVIDGVTYQSTGLDDLDALIGGLRGGATYIVAARSSMGKTALMCSIAHHVAKSKPCYIATLEMPRREIASRLMAIDANLNIGNAKNWGDEDYLRLTKAAASLKDLNITIDHEEGLSLSKLRARTRRMKRRGGLGCIFVDYIQLMKAKADTREREVALISEGLKSLAKELDVPVVALAQLNRDCDKRADKRPLMSDLRESGSIEQDADVIVMLYRDEVYNKETQYKGTAELLVRKNRHGAIGEIYAKYQSETMHFKNKAYDWQIPQEQERPYRRGFD